MNAREARYKLDVARTLLGTGMVAPVRPDKALRSLLALRRWGPTPAAAYTGAAITWDHITKSQENITPANLDWNGSLAIAPMAIPGKTPVV